MIYKNKILYNIILLLYLHYINFALLGSLYHIFLLYHIFKNPNFTEY